MQLNLTTLEYVFTLLDRERIFIDLKLEGCYCFIQAGMLHNQVKDYSVVPAISGLLAL